jgi:hypothetical protein
MMRRIFLLFALFCIQWLYVDAQIGVDVNGPSGPGTANTNTFVTPYSTVWEDGRHQYLYLASELIAAGATPGIIDSIGFYVTSVGSPNPSNLSIRVRATTAVNATAFDAGPFTTVFSTPLYTPVVGLGSFKTTAAFFWDGVSNLLVDVCYDNTAWTSGTGVRASTHPANMTYYLYKDGDVGCNLDPTSSLVNLGSTADRPDLRIAFLAASGRDARMTTLLSPNSMIIGANPITVRVANVAADPILSVDLAYSVNGGPAVTVTGVTPASPLSSGQAFDYTFAAPFNATTQGAYTIRTWLSNANGLGADNNVSNDTLISQRCTGLTGTYTIGAGGNYPTIQAAVNDIVNCGISSNVTFQVFPGTYYGTYTIANMPSNGGSSTISFTSSTGLASDVILIHDTAAAATNRAHFTVNTPIKVSFSNLSFRRTINPGSATGCINYSAVAQAEVINCDFVDVPEVVSTFNIGIQVNGGSGLITGNTFRGFYYSVFLNGPATNPFVSGNQVFANTSTRYLFRAFYALNQNDAIITNNNISGFASTSTTGAGIWAANGYNLTIASNKITGDMSSSGIILSNLNADTLNVTQNASKIYNNVIAGSLSPTITSTTAVPALISVTGSFSATAAIPNPRDAYEIVNNTVNYRINTTSTSTFSGGLYFTGGSATTPAYAYVNVRNNHIEVNPVSGSLPAAFRLVRYTQTSIIDSLTSTHNNYRMGGATVPAFFRDNLAGVDHATVLDWQTATGKDANSGAIDAVFISPTLPLPSSTGFDNRGTPISYVSADVDNNPRSTTTPDIGAYEFVGSVFSQIAVTLLSDTLLGPNRVLTVSITDSSSTITPNTARLFYKKSTQSLWVIDSLPSISGNNYSFVIDTLRLGGTRAMDTIQYYVAVRNATNTVTTAPLGGNGLFVSNQTVPPSVFSYRILPIASGNYRVGTSGPAEFATLTAAANFYSSAFLSGPVSFTLIDTSYTVATGETFPIVFLGRPTSTATFTTTIAPAANRSSVLIEGNAPTLSGALVLRGVKWFTIDGSNNSTTSRNLTIRTNSTATNNAAVFIRSVPGDPANDVTLRNLNVVGGSTSITSTFGVMAQGLAPSTSGTADSLRNLTIDNISVARAYYAIYVRGNATNLSSNVTITNNSIGSLDTANFVIFRGIDVQNIVNANISRNTIFNLVSSTATTQAAIEVGGAALRNNRINRNLIWGIKNFNTGGWGAYGISVLSGDSVIIDNNVMYDIRTINYSTTSQSWNPFGIRLGGGLAHRVHYNSVYLYGNLTNTNTTTGSSGAAFGIASTAVTGDVRNNIFANTTSSVTTASMHNAIWVPAGYNFANLTLNNNAYHVDTIAQNAVGRIGITGTGVAYTTVADWKLVSSVGNPSNDNLSVPPVARTIPPFVSLTDLTIPAGTATGIESGAVAIAALGTPNTDFTGANRPGGTAIAPDMGAYEFNGVALPDIFPPSFDSILVSNNQNECVPTNRTITVFARDNVGGRGIDTVRVFRSVNGTSTASIVLTRTAGTALAGTWTGVVPAAGPDDRLEFRVQLRDSLGNFSPLSNAFSYRDAYLGIEVFPGTRTVQIGDTVILRSSTRGVANVKITEVVQFRTGTGATPAYPAFAAGADLVEITNLGSGPADISGFGFEVFGTGPRTYTFPANVVIPGNGILILHIGTGTDDPANRYYNTGGSTDGISSISQTGYILRNTTGTHVDAVATNGYTFPASSGVTAAMWSGNIGSMTSGCTRVNSDNNVAADWVVATAALPMSIGTANAGMTTTTPPASVVWNTTPPSLSDTLVVGPFTAPGTYTFIGTLSDTRCSVSDTAVITVGAQNPDVGVSRIMSPVAGSSHNGSTPVQVGVMIKNFGSIPATGFDVEFRVNGGQAIVTNSVTQMMMPGDSMQHTFTVAWTPTISGPITICANTTGMPNELIRWNDTACVSVNSTVSLEQLALNNRLIGSVYPNPATTEVNFEFNEFTGKGTLEVLDQLGRVVALVELNRTDNASYTLRTDDWAAGMYSYRLTTLTQLQTGKLVIRK